MAKPALTGIARLDTLLTLANVALLLALFIIFFKQWRKTKATFALGLVLFAAVFLLKEVLSVFQSVARENAGIVTLVRLDVGVALAEAIALAILLFIVAQ